MTLPSFPLVRISVRAPGLGFSCSFQPVRSLPLKSAVHLVASFVSTADRGPRARTSTTIAVSSTPNFARCRTMWEYSLGWEIERLVALASFFNLGQLTSLRGHLFEVGRDVGLDAAQRPRQSAG